MGKEIKMLTKAKKCYPQKRHLKKFDILNVKLLSNLLVMDTADRNIDVISKYCTGRLYYGNQKFVLENTIRDSVPILVL